MTRRIKSYFITGLLVIVPLYISIYVITLIVGFVDGVVNLLPSFLHPHTYLPRVPGIGFIFTVLGIFVIGALASNFAGKRLLNMGEGLLSKIPVLRMLYNGTKQFMETFFAKEQQGLRKVVLVEFPRKGVYSVGFVTSKASGEIKDRTFSEGTLNVFLPTTPNPTSGFYMVVREEDVIALDMTVEDAFKVIMTGGMVVPETKTVIKKNSYQ